jgi:hypothetical protein
MSVVENNYSGGSFVVGGGMPQIDEKVVLRQKEKALKELESRVKLATSQHNSMYQLQRDQIIAEHDRQLQLAKVSIEDEKDTALMALEHAYIQNCKSIDHSALTQKISIEQQANALEIQAVQQMMAQQHADRERQWSSSYMSNSHAMMQPTLFSHNIQLSKN